MIEEQRIEAAVRDILNSIGDDPSREGLRETPRRVARMYAELFSGIGVDPRSALDTVFEEESHSDSEEVVIVRDMPFFALCEHHLLPFYGHVHTGYIPNGRIAGASKMARALEVLARRPQLQERLGSQLADAMHDVLRPDGAAVVIEAEHLCISMRGVKKPGARVVTSATRGSFEKRGISKGEFLALLHKSGR